jgi:exosortase/archaeosortase family protein
MPNVKVLLARFGAFLALFGVISGVIGPWVVGSRLLYGFDFYIYGNMGKVLLIGALAFLFLAKDKLSGFDIPKYKKVNIFFIFVAFGLVKVFFIIGGELLKFTDFSAAPVLALVGHMVLMLSVISLGVGVFTFDFIGAFVRVFKKELGVCLILAVFLYFMIFKVWELWPLFSGAVLGIVSFIYRALFPGVFVIAPRTLVVQGFSVEIAQACSGVDSLFLFTVLYWFFGFVDWKEFNRKKLFLAFFPAAFGLFMVNVFRIFLLVLIGVVYSRDLALSLFHTYAGLLLFVVYFGVSCG